MSSSSSSAQNAKKPKMTVNDEPSAPPVCPFAAATKHRSFKIIIEGKTLFVSPHSMAEMSSFFETLCFGDFKEGIEKKAKLKDVKYDDLVEMLNVMGADCSKDRKEIEASNCALVMRLSHRWAIDVLMSRCIEYINTKLPHTSSTFSSTLELLIACGELQIDEEPLRKVASRLASFDPDLLLYKGVSRQIKDPSLCAAIFLAAKNDRYTANGDAHVFVDETFAFAPGKGRECPSCSRKQTRMCRVCKRDWCLDHARQPCPDRVLDAERIEKRFGKEPQSARLATLDKHFFAK